MEGRTFRDGILTIIELNANYRIGGVRMFLDAEHDDPISLAEIQERYPRVSHVIFEDMFSGEVWTYGNHRDIQTGEKLWEKVGKTCGYA